MTIQKSDLTVLIELRNELKSCSPNEFELRRAHMLGLVEWVLDEDRQVDAMKRLAEAFCEHVSLSSTAERRPMQTAEQARARFERLGPLFAPGLNCYWLEWLFYELERKATSAMLELAAVAQTTKPEIIKHQLEGVFFRGKWEDGRLVALVREEIGRAAICVHQEYRDGIKVIVLRKQPALNVLDSKLIYNASRALKADKIKGGASKKLLSPEKDADLRRECHAWLQQPKAEQCKAGAFDMRMAIKYAISKKTAEKVRLEVKREIPTC